MQQEFRILGPVEAVYRGLSVPLGGLRVRTLLGVLLIHRGEIVPVSRLVEALWPGGPPAGATVTLRTHVSHLRRALADANVDLLTVRPAGYRLLLDCDRLDAGRFERLAGEGRRALHGGDAGQAAGALAEALALWRGPVLADLGHPPFAAVQTARLDELRLTALEDRIEADLVLGSHRELVAELEQFVEAHPFRERPCGQLMRALYRAGRQADALALYQATHRRLTEELGVAPGPALRELQAAILRHDQRLAAGPAATHAVPRRRPAAASPASPAGGSTTGTTGHGETPSAQMLVPLVDFARRGPLVSRRAELDLLRDRWEQVVAGQRRVVLVGGEAGVGKTRLVAELAGLVADDALLLVGHCDHRALAAYQPIAEALRTSPDAVEAVRAADGSLDGRVLALLGDSLPGTAAAGVGRRRGTDPGGERFALCDAVTRLLARLAADRPVLLVVEDLERVDHATSLLLHHLARGLPARVLLVLTFRDPPGSEHPPLRELLASVERRGGADRLMLQVLDEAELAVLVCAITGSEPPASFVRLLWQRTGGNPFYAGEVVRYLGVDQRLGGGNEHGVSRGVPASVRDVLRGRLHELPEAARHLLRCAALVGGEVDAALLEAVAGLPEDLLVDAVQQATRSGLLVEVARSRSAAYALSHALVREAVYADIPVPRRRRLHLRAARALVGSGRGADLAVAALHLWAAGPLADPGEAAEPSASAAAAAHLRYAWDEAAAHIEAALELLEAGGAPPARRAVVAGRAGMPRWHAGADLGKALDSLATALDLYRGLGDERCAARVRSRLGAASTTHATVTDIPRALEHLQAAAAMLTEGLGEGLTEGLGAVGSSEP